MRKFLSAALLAAILLFSCKSDGALLSDRLSESAPLMAKVFNGHNRSLNGVWVTLENPQGDSWEARTDITGKALFPPLPFGSYRVSIESEGMEPVRFTFDFYGSDQALYSRIYSQEELLCEAETSMDQGKWEQAQDFIRRAEAIGGDIKLTAWYRAVLYWQQGWTDSALEQLLLIQETPGRTAPEVFLFAADIYEYEKKDPQNALDYLKLSLELENSRLVRQRIENLQKSIQETETEKKENAFEE